jgi:excisionase family DNA binding protein
MIGNGQPRVSTVRLRGPALYNITDTARALALGRTKVYELIASGELESVRVGRRRLVPAHAIADLVERLCAGDELCERHHHAAH